MYYACHATCILHILFRPCLPTLLKLLQNLHVLLTFDRCTIPCACHEKRHLVRTCGKCASRHSSVHFFNISTSKSAPTLVWFVRFHCEMCLAPQWPALFPSQIPNVLGVFSIVPSKSASRHNGVQFFISHLTRWIRTRHFSEPTFRPQKN